MNLNTHATNISQATGKDRGNCYKALKTLLDKINQEEIESLSYNSDFSQVTINEVDFFQDARKHWKRADVHQPIHVVKTVESKSMTATQVDVKVKDHVSEEALALVASMMCFATEENKVVETQKPYYIGERQEVLDEEGKPQLIGGILVEHAPDSCVDDPTAIDAKACVFTADEYKKQQAALYTANGYSQYDADVSANAQVNAFTTKHDPELTGRYERTADDSFLFNGKEVRFNEKDMEFQM